MLVLDSLRDHLMADVNVALSDGKTDLLVIPWRLTSILQPLDSVCERYEWMLATIPRPPLAAYNVHRL